jgi:putative transposase
MSNGMELRAVVPGSPWKNGLVESFHSRLRDEFLDRTVFENVADAKAQADAWEFNTVRPHSGLSYKTRQEFAATCDGPKAGKTKTKNPRRRKIAK